LPFEKKRLEWGAALTHQVKNEHRHGAGKVIAAPHFTFLNKSNALRLGLLPVLLQVFPGTVFFFE
jgi:hypothetical protein